MKTTSTLDPNVAADGHRLLEFIWPLSALAIFLALFVPWYLRLIALDIGLVVWLVIGIGGLHLFVAPALPRIEHAALRDLALLGTHFAAVTALAAVWFEIGGLAAPLFLLFFAAPVIAASALFGPWSRQLSLVFTLLVISLAAALSSAGLRWYATEHGLPLEWLGPAAQWLSRGHEASSTAEPALECAWMLLVVVALVALHLSAGAIADTGRRLQAELASVVSGLHRDRGLLGEMQRASPLAEVLLLAGSRQIVMASDAFIERVGGARELAGVDLRDVLRLQYPEALEPLLAEGGMIECRYRGAVGEFAAGRVHARMLGPESARLVRLVLEPCEGGRQTELAFENLELSVLVLDARGEIAQANAAARALFPEAHAGASARAALDVAGLPEGWWQCVPGTTVPRDLQFKERRLRGRVACRGADARLGEQTIIELTAERA